jgi:hypothetical protein
MLSHAGLCHFWLLFLHAFLRYPLKKWWKVRVERVGIPMLTAIPADAAAVHHAAVR